ncbi:MAG TPA: PPC domain-containing protein [Aggregatilineales bacterium]|nr:pre-peptidase C-terminal domain-containing protein [Anaerolineales bacterium]HRE49126.1 PPC domain-containing protein [Aggregatilineales bacterium]
MSQRDTFMKRTLYTLLASVLVVGALLSVSPSQGQGGNTRKIAIGDQVRDTLNAQNFARIFAFDGQIGLPVTVTVTTDAAGLGLALILTDSDGNTVGQSAPDTATPGTVSLSNIVLNDIRPYFITVLRASGVEGTAAGEFLLTLSSAAVDPVTPTTVSLARGLSITLSWQTTDDLDIEVRDPLGGSVYFNNTSVPSGGTLSGNANNGCTQTTRNPSESVRWAGGSIPAGSYEVLVYFNRACNEPAAPATFSAVVNVDGTALPAVTGTLNLNEQYVFSFVISSAEQFALREGGANPLLLNLTPFASRLANPAALGTRTNVSGRIGNSNPVDVWSFNGTAGQIVTIQMDAIQGGSLDAQLILLDGQGNVVASNDDASNVTRNAAIVNKALPSTGLYVIVATRFGKIIGGTEGNYQLAITTTGGTVAGATPAVSPTPGGIILQPTPVGGGSVGLPGFPSGSITVSLTWNNRADVRLLIRDPLNRSLFSDVRNISGGGVLERTDNLNCQNLTAAPTTYAYFPIDPPLIGTYEVQVWMNNLCNEPTPPTYTLVVSVRGQEVIRETNRPDLNRNITVNTFSVDSAGTATATKGGIFARQLGTDIGDISGRIPDALALVYGGTSTGVIDVTSPYVVYTFQARAGDRVRIAMRSISGTLDPFLYLLDSTGLQLAQNDDVQPGQDANSRIDAVIPADGGYIVVASRFGAVFGGTSGSYEISLSPLGR